jgi:hypothetical protein
MTDQATTEDAPVLAAGEAYAAECLYILEYWLDDLNRWMPCTNPRPAKEIIAIRLHRETSNPKDRHRIIEAKTTFRIIDKLEVPA